MNIPKKKALLVGAAAVACAGAVQFRAISADLIESRTTVITACGKLFEIDANAAGLTAAERAQIVQKNLDGALIAAKDRTPEAVEVAMMNRNPIITLDHYYIVTADGNSAARHNVTQLQLAEQWADKIRMCLADSTAVNKYVSMLTGKFPGETKVVTVSTKGDVAVAPWGTLLPIKLKTPISAISSKLGDPVEATLSSDVPLGPSFQSYLPKGSVAFGKLVDAGKFVPNHKGSMTVEFQTLRTPDGKEIPIYGHVLGGINKVEEISVVPKKAICDNPSEALMTEVTGNEVSLAPSKGEIAGAWRGLPEDKMTQSLDRRYVISKHEGLGAGLGKPMMLELEATTTIGLKGSTVSVASQGPGQL